jgi:hypothetical protein
MCIIYRAKEKWPPNPKEGESASDYKQEYFVEHRPSGHDFVEHRPSGAWLCGT